MYNLLAIFESAANKLVLKTACQNWGLIFINLFTNFLSVFFEGSTLGVIFVAVTFISAEKGLQSESQILQFLGSISLTSSENIFLLLIFGAVGLQIFLSLSKYVNKVSAAYLSAKAQPLVTGKIFEQIMGLSYGCVSRYKVGDLLLFVNDAAEAIDIQIHGINNLIVCTSFAVVYLFVIVNLSPNLALAAGLLTLLIGILQYRLIPRLKKVVAAVTDTQVESSKFITESIQGLQVLHTFGTQVSTLNQAIQLLEKTKLQLQKRAFLYYIPEPAIEIMPIVSLALLATFAVLFQDDSSTLLPLLLTFILSLQRLSVRLKMIVDSISKLTDNTANMMRINSILNPKDKEFENSGNVNFSGLNSDITFQNVSLVYENTDRIILDRLTFAIPQRQITAIIGGSGAGKSSLVGLMMGLYQPTDGEIVVNDRDLTEFQIEQWRHHIGVVSQDTFIFNTSIFKNLCYGRPDASFEEVLEAAKTAQVHEFVSDLPEGYETIVGERGFRLSGGQRQRLALARALVKKPDILILDEATSVLDSASEQLIQKALEALQGTQTMIIIAHRLSTITHADQIIVLDKGQIIEKGTHHSLLAQSGHYANYWQLQSQQSLV